MWHTIRLEEVEKDLKTDLSKGLTKEEVEKRQKKYGENKLADKKKDSLFVKLIKQFDDFMIIILIVASIVSAVVSYMDKSGDYIDSVIIIVIVVFNAIMGLVQEFKAEKSLEALKKMSAPTAKVKRDGITQTIKGTEVVPGDVVILEAGNYVPADCRIIEAFNLKVEEATLTGETLPVLKDAKCILKQDIPLGDTFNMAFGTTIVVEGNARAVITETGMNTSVGRIAKMIIEDESPETPIQKKLGEVGKTLGIACLIICFFVFLIGIVKDIPIQEMFMTSVGLAVAAIPEGLPAIVTIMLSIGVTKMAKKNTIIRRLPAVETLGSSSVICSDKTGTLTKNRMQVVEVYNINGKVENKIDKKQILQFGAMCTNSEIVTQDRKTKVIGEATEIALVNAAIDIEENKNELYKIYPRVNEIPFDSTRKLMTTIHKLQNGTYRIITKGAPDVLLKKCDRIVNGRVDLRLSAELPNIPLHDINIKIINDYNKNMAKNALRVLAVAYLDVKVLPSKIDSESIEKNLIFVGLIGMIDPPREGVKEAISTCKRAGIKTVMITGDHILTAKAIAKDLGIYKTGDFAITGSELDNIPEDKLKRDIMNYSVFARVSPQHKSRIVKAFRSTGAVVAMTGDGVNDAPALKTADIGISMGIGGTDVAKNASDMILVDDNFVTIVESVKQGRNIFNNIIKAVHFLIATNIGEIVTIFLGLILGFKSPLLAIQLLWINLVTDSLPAIALGLEPEDKDIMNKKPRPSGKGIFADGLWGKIFVEGFMIGLLTILAFGIGNNNYGLEVGRTMAFVSLGILELVHSFNIRSEESIFKVGMAKNKYLLGAFILGLILQIIIVCIPNVAQVFKLVPLNNIQWLYTILISISPLFIMEIQKKLNEIRFGKTIYEYRKI